MALSHHIAINQRQAMRSNPPRQRRELNQVTPTSQVRGRCLFDRIVNLTLFSAAFLYESQTQNVLL